MGEGEQPAKNANIFLFQTVNAVNIAFWTKNMSQVTI